MIVELSGCRNLPHGSRGPDGEDVGADEDEGFVAMGGIRRSGLGGEDGNQIEATGNESDAGVGTDCLEHGHADGGITPLVAEFLPGIEADQGDAFRNEADGGR